MVQGKPQRSRRGGAIPNPGQTPINQRSMATLTSREKKLLGLCLFALLAVASMIGLKEYLDQRSALLAKVQSLRARVAENESWLKDGAFWEKRRLWLRENMPVTESLGRAQGILLEELENSALDAGLTLEQPTLPPLSDKGVDTHREVKVGARLRGDQDKLMRWLNGLQDPQRFVVLEELGLELDAKARSKIPQLQCQMVLARWFQPTQEP